MILAPSRNKHLSSRYLANVIDYLVFLFLIGAYIDVMGEDINGTQTVEGWNTFPMLLMWFLYFPLCEAIGGQTFGKLIFRLYVVDLSGNTALITHASLRRMLDIFEMMTLGIVALFTINNTDKNQRVGDLIAGTTVIKREAACRFCGTNLELSRKEVMNGTFTCPNCQTVN